MFTFCIALYFPGPSLLFLGRYCYIDRSYRFFYLLEKILQISWHKPKDASGEHHNPPFSSTDWPSSQMLGKKYCPGVLLLYSLASQQFMALAAAVHRWVNWPPVLTARLLSYAEGILCLQKTLR
jgi:hypothetical protein